MAENQIAEGIEQRAEIREESSREAEQQSCRASSREQQAGSREQKTDRREQRTESREQKTATGNLLQFSLQGGDVAHGTPQEQEDYEEGPVTEQLLWGVKGGEGGIHTNVSMVGGWP